MRSPRDDAVSVPEASKFSRSFVIYEQGTRPPTSVKAPGKGVPALWRGVDAGGKDTEEMRLEGNAWMPKDDRARPSTLPG